ncbi:hypothetical protein PLICRDRAFT_178793 [Plicaturopsis crispa FD-325 SS-3]|uniref:F-box domain-containing protein n=1 Tax=Plicaturopsis crispa FD-325 SS-3 TaxID=944288 RepID=A0A0C9SYF8_PLICR|nr:hypothetical protein PLICRDRAFT_178793 [Plicaturopsis crispa FD-325 SS-3]
MSCSICLLPFTPAPGSTCPRPPPRGILDTKQYTYFQYAIGLGSRIGGVVSPFEYLDGNNFRNTSSNLMIMMCVWESSGGTDFMCHAACAKMVRHALGMEGDDFETLVEIAGLEKVLGRPMGGAKAGWLPDIRYKELGTPHVDMAKYWETGDEPGGNMFRWKAFKDDGFEWMFNRPDMFPKFKGVSEKRKKSIGEPKQPTSDIITTQPLDVIQILLPYLSTPSYMALTSTCRILRKYALCEFQPEARRRVLELGWAVPLRSEYEKNASKAFMASARIEESPVDADWLLYLCHVHKTAAMRMRRRVWEISQGIARVWKAKRPMSVIADTVGENGELVKSAERRKLESSVQQSLLMSQMLPPLGG